MNKKTLIHSQPLDAIFHLKWTNNDYKGWKYSPLWHIQWTRLLCKTKTKLSQLGRIKKKKSERFSLTNLFCVALMDIGVPQSIWHYFQPSRLCFNCMFCLFFKLNLGSVLNTVYGWTRSHSLTLLLPSPHISTRGVIILQLAGQQYIVPLSEMGLGGCFALTPHWRLNWHSAATQCSATHKHTGCNQQSSAWFCVFPAERL